jgi:hypothetical protein
MHISYFAMAGAIVASFAFAHVAKAQEGIHEPGSKQIGTPSGEHSQIVPSLYVLNAQSATLTGDTLVLNGVPPSVIVFADRPVRAAGHELTKHLIEDWAVGDDSFGKDPPNATVSVFNKEGSSVKDAVVVLNSPKLEGDKLTFTVEVLEGDLGNADGAASIFIDIIGRPLTPLSYAGVGRRTMRRGAFYAGAAVGAAAAYGAPYARPACGYYPYPPCY